ncbi:Putative mRNA decapping protein 2, Box A [Colletotrichum destructivum]|uniref:mRNA decapping protein 2, Box A n=1 Tax=Colletotrichum destructivum TaxID=34406 RepID=A0AAX4HYE4_9PEZI|nr:Putative mRNA decapping protein 2, Box A [Colletotrichum destructivum]
MAEEKMQLEDWLDDLCVRFIINLPEEDLSSVARICFQIEEAQWFYEDFVRPLDPTLPSMTLRSFSLRIFQHCPLLAPFSVENHTKAFEEFLQYKTRVPVRGAILLNEAMDSTILVKGWKKGANWSFPRGKINKDEDDLECAVREVYEETGYDLHAAGLVPENRDDVKYIEVTMREQQLRLYVFRDVPMDTHFQPRTRKEISKIQWYKLSELPAFRKKGNQPQNDAAAAANANKFYMVAPFLVPLKKWVVQQKRKDAVKAANEAHFNPYSLHEEPLTEDDVWQTEPATDVSNRTPGLDTLEGATQELQRLLKVKPTAAQATSKPASPDVGSDKGASLLAILQAKNQAAAQGMPITQLPHTPLDHTTREAPLPHSPHGQHHPQQRAPLASYQAPPEFPVVPDGTPQSWAFNQSGNSGPVPPQVRHHDPSMMGGPAYVPHPPLRHPQPLPPQVQQTLLARGGFADTTPPPPPKHAQGTVNQPMANAQFPQVHFQQQTQNILYRNKLPSAQLSNHSMALLGVLKSDTKTDSPDRAHQTGSQPFAPTPSGHDQPFSGIQGHGGVSAYVQPPVLNVGEQQHHQVNPAVNSRSQQPGDPLHRSTLLQMFKKPEIHSPPTNQPAELPANTASATLMKGLSTVKATNQGTHSPVFQSRVAQPVSSSPLSRPPQGVSDVNSQVNIQSLSLQPQGGRREHQSPQPIAGYNSRAAENRVPSYQGTYSHPAVNNNQSPQMFSSQIHQRGETLNKSGGPRAPALASILGAAGADKPSSLASPPAASALPAPGGLQQKSQMSTEQRQKLLSLFGKPQSPSPGPAFDIDDKGKTREMAAPDGSKRSRVASLASASGQGAPEGLPESRRGSQTPISPADRSFLLGYLASVANAK